AFLPSWPEPFAPQVQTVPSLLSSTPCPVPAATAVRTSCARSVEALSTTIRLPKKAMNNRKLVPWNIHPLLGCVGMDKRTSLFIRRNPAFLQRTGEQNFLNENGTGKLRQFSAWICALSRREKENAIS